MTKERLEDLVHDLTSVMYVCMYVCMYVSVCSNPRQLCGVVIIRY